MSLRIYLCPMYQALYNETQMVLNNQINKPQCYGTPDWTANPPVLTFRFPLNDSSISSCNNKLEVFYNNFCKVYINYGTLLTYVLVDLIPWRLKGFLWHAEHFCSWFILSSIKENQSNESRYIFKTPPRNWPENVYMFYLSLQ